MTDETRSPYRTSAEQHSRTSDEAANLNSATWTPQEGDYAQKIKSGSNVHICLTAVRDDYGVKVRMACGAAWYAGVLNHVSEEVMQWRPCRKCWEAM